MRAGLAASTLTPGITAPGASLATPAMLVAWAAASAGTIRTIPVADTMDCRQRLGLMLSPCLNAGYANANTISERSGVFDKAWSRQRPSRRRLSRFVLLLVQPLVNTADAAELGARTSGVGEKGLVRRQVDSLGRFGGE